MVTTHRSLLWCSAQLSFSGFAWGRNVQRLRLGKLFVLLAAFLFAVTPNVSAVQAKYVNAEEAYAVGAAFRNAKNFAASLEPLEMALQLAKDDAMRLKASEALLGTYRELANVPKFVERAEFVIEKSDSDPKRSITRRELLGFVHKHGKADELIQRHEETLKKEPNNRTSLFILSEAYDNLKKDAKRAAELTEKLIALEKTQGKPQNVSKSATLASQYAKLKKFKEAAELYEQIAPLDEKLSAWHWKEAANCWLQMNDNAKALEAARKSAKAPPEARSGVLVYFWRKSLGDTFLKAGDAPAAIPQYEDAIKNATGDSARKECEKLLAEAKAKLRT